MFSALADRISRRRVAWTVVSAAGLAMVLAVALLPHLQQDDNLLAFLPAGDPAVRDFEQLNAQFGGLDVALVGIRAPDVFAGPFLARLARLTRGLGELRGVDAALSLANVVDFREDPAGGIVTGPLIDDSSRGTAAARRQQVLGRDHVVGRLVARDGRALLIYCFLLPGGNVRATAAAIQRQVLGEFPPDDVFWAGAPFIQAHVYNATLRDLSRLTPVAVAAMIVVLLLAFRSLATALLALLSTTFGVLVALSTMALTGTKLNLALGSMPVIVFALGSAYSIHVLARYRALSLGGDPAHALRESLRRSGPPVLVAGLTTAASLAAFASMDLRPLRLFGLFSALGVIGSLFAALVLVPAVVALLGRTGSRPSSGAGLDLGRLSRHVWSTVLRYRLAVGVGVLVVAAAAAAAASRVEARVELDALLSPTSPPMRAERFMRRHFGGSEFLQLRLEGDMTDPAVVRQVQWVADSLFALPGISAVTHIGQVLGRANEAMTGQRRIPQTPAQIELLYALMSGDAWTGLLLDSDRRHALVHLRLAVDGALERERLVSSIERWLRSRGTSGLVTAPAASPRARAWLAQQALAGAIALAKRQGARVDARARRRAQVWLETQGTAQQLPTELIAERLRRFLGSEECATALSPAQQRAVSTGVASLPADAPPGRLRQLLRASLESTAPGAASSPAGADRLAALVDDLAISLATPLQEIQQQGLAQVRAQSLARVMGLGVAARSLVPAMYALSSMNVLVPDPNGSRRVGAILSGWPVLHRALARSTVSNQRRSLITALLPVLLITGLLFRSLRAGLLVSCPTLLALLIVYGGMGIWRVRLDIGTSMIACIILGAGVDYAVHLVAAARGAATRPSDTTGTANDLSWLDESGRAILVSAVMVALGFTVLTLGQSRPMQNVGRLTAWAMIVSALATFIVVPLLTGRVGRSAVVEAEVAPALAPPLGVGGSALTGQLVDPEEQECAD